MFTRTGNLIISTSSQPQTPTLLYKLSGGPDNLGFIGPASDRSEVKYPLSLSEGSLSVLPQYNLSTTDYAMVLAQKALLYNQLLGTHAPFAKTFIIRGIGYQTGVVDNIPSKEFPYTRYLILRVGHSFNLYKPIPNYIGVRISHKDRKLVVYGASKEQVSNYARVIFKLRPPSVYTGRGIRIKKGNHRRKLGKKDIRKGKA